MAADSREMQCRSTRWRPTRCLPTRCLPTRRNFCAGVAALFAGARFAVAAKPFEWNRIRYQGGTIDVKVNPFDWNTTISLSSGQMEMKFAGRKTVRVPVEKITRIGYGEKAYRRIADMAVLSVFLSPVALFGLLHKSKDHIISIEFANEDNSSGAVLLTVHKDQIEPLLTALSMATKKSIEDWP